MARNEEISRIVRFELAAVRNTNRLHRFSLFHRPMALISSWGKVGKFLKSFRRAETGQVMEGVDARGIQTPLRK